MFADFRPSKEPTDREVDKRPNGDEGPSFVPPEIVAESEKDSPSPQSSPKLPKALHRHKHRLIKWWRNRAGWQKLLIIGFLLIALAGLGLTVYAYTRPKPPVIAEPQKAELPPKPTTEASRLSGVQVDPELNKLPVTGIMIENSPDARPQSGLREAGVVFEAIAEGGITRFLALYQEGKPKYVGPVRSARPYYLRWLLGFDAPLAHVGGSPDALADIRNLHVKDLDQFYNSDSYQRVSNRYAPHNVYTSLDKLLALEKSKGWTSSDFIGFPRKAEKPLAVPKAKSIDVAISGALYNVHYAYDKANNNYKRSEGGAAHRDERSGKQLTPKVVIVLVTTQGYLADGLHSSYKTIGSGKAYIFQDGGVTVGTWEKKSNDSQLLFGNASGAPLALNPGQTWITAVGSSGAVSYKP